MQHPSCSHEIFGHLHDDITNCVHKSVHTKRMDCFCQYISSTHLQTTNEPNVYATSCWILKRMSSCMDEHPIQAIFSGWHGWIFKHATQEMLSCLERKNDSIHVCVQHLDEAGPIEYGGQENIRRSYLDIRNDSAHMRIQHIDQARPDQWKELYIPLFPIHAKVLYSTCICCIQNLCVLPVGRDTAWENAHKRSKVIMIESTFVCTI